ncbi:unnamed protein product [Spirodela intermedia]|uniref:Uncharacterized protein n=1 Tax=Spirodela intermedia TaxID=51605 RepID=A0A7I8IBY9_SPIIN|nr:unnamed protein product [Spirodela intermedia]CAA6655108.1 unnamed protein product [Spirodela intermedia]
MVYFRENTTNTTDGGEGDDLDRRNSSAEEGSSGANESVSSETSGLGQGSGTAAGGLGERFADAPTEGGDGDLLLACDELERGVLQWLRALDLHVIGACRVDERLKPLFKLNISSGIAEDRLVAQLSQHFEATEIGTLARCLCVPLVSVRVGRVNKEGALLCPIATKGYLQLTLLPTSDMRLSFYGDNGVKESLAVVSHLAGDSEVTIEEISADGTGRTFLLRLSVNHLAYFWCSEKSQFLGSELLSKMKDLLRRRPSLSQLTGISELRLDSFATHLRAYLLRPPITIEASSGAHPSTVLMETARIPVSNPGSRPAPAVPSFSHARSGVGRPTRTATSSNPRCGGEDGPPPPGAGDPPAEVSTSSARCGSPTGGGGGGDDDEARECSRSRPLHQPQPFRFPEIPNLSYLSSSFSPSQVVPAPPSPSLFSPYYCWCPPLSSLQNPPSVPPHHPPSMASEGTLLFPPLDLAEGPALDLDLPLIFPLPSFAAKSSAQQIPTFTPFMSDPIVHVPVIDVCSSGGQGYLVSAGPAISSAVPPLHPGIVSPLLPEVESSAEKNARETLRMLMAASAPATPQLIEVIPAVLTTVSDGFPCLHHVSISLCSVPPPARGVALAQSPFIFLSDLSGSRRA